MAFKDIFKDSNEINEKNIVGFAAFIIMVIIAIADIVTGLYGIEFTVEKFIYDSLLYITLGCFGISEFSKMSNSKKEETTKIVEIERVDKPEKKTEEKEEPWY